MSNLRKLVATALRAADLSDDPLRETALDRIGALAFSDALGSKLWRLRWSYDASCFKPAALLLWRRTQRPHENNKIHKVICEVVLGEWLDDLCRTCHGRGHAVVKGTGRAGNPCTVCNGTGSRRHNDLERMRSTGLSAGAYRKWEPRFASAHAALSAADVQAWLDVARQLERITGGRIVAKKFLELRSNRSIIGVSGTTAHPGTTPTTSGTSATPTPAHNSNDMPARMVGLKSQQRGTVTPSIQSAA